MREGLLPQKPTCVMRLSTTEKAARHTTDLLGEMFDPTETAVAAFETDAGDWLLEAYFAHDPDETWVRDLIRPIVGDEANRAQFTQLTAQDWVKASLDGLKPVRAGRFLVYGEHDTGVARPHEWAMRIDAALAFGTGHHGTTHGCLLALEAELKKKRPSSVLDVGTGTGILAFGAARALHMKIVAGDIDPVAVDVARSNAWLNRLHPWLDFYVGAGLQHTLTRGKRFEIIMANILARPLCRLAPTMSRALSLHGRLILSGLLVSDVPAVLSAYRTQGLYCVKRSVREGWATLVLARGTERPALHHHNL
jgi:ribosomal protein L11 methyltransferase